jgi:hypothetical protein
LTWFEYSPSESEGSEQIGRLRATRERRYAEREVPLGFRADIPSPDPSAHNLGLPDSMNDFAPDTTRAVAQLHYGNTFARCNQPKTRHPS